MGGNVADEAAANSAEEAGCAVDWSWLEGREIAGASSDLQRLVIRFTDGETLTVQASIWQGQPFLAFTPYRARDQGMAGA